MLVRRLASAAVVCALSVLSIVMLGGCGTEEEARREGLALELDGVTYNVLITRQLNLNDVEDRGYAELPPAPPGSTYYGVFLQACNVSDPGVPLRTASNLQIVTTQEEEFEPVALQSGNPFAYEPVTLEPDQCIPEVGSVASEGPTAGALVVFELPIEATEDRPLELVVKRGYDLQAGEPRELLFELDI